jgi:ribosomal subunit interface protein
MRDLIRIKEVHAMLIDTRAMGFALTDALLRHVEARMESALGPFSRWVLKATVRLEDVNGDRGGDDKRCSIVAALRRHRVEIAEATNADLYAAVDEAANRIRRSVRRATKRQLARDRRDPQRPGALVTF